MCGICGYSGGHNDSLLRAMTNALTHRGPNDIGTWHNNRVSLGMRRLSIIDLETGKQPIQNETSTIWVVFNGEIYNYTELRTHLESLGHIFRTHHSDTEVIVHLYEEYGSDFLNKLNGMFAIALWDDEKKELHLARDRVGIKPLFFSYINNKSIVFSSEIKSILLHPDVGKEPNFSALYHYFSFKNTPAPLTAFSNIYQLRAGERLVYKDGVIKKYRWWKPEFSDLTDITEDDASKRILELLKDSIRLRMQSDVPFGAYLSGGIDSSAVVSLMCEMTDIKIKTFTLVYDDTISNKTDDRKFAEQISRKYSTDHYEYLLNYHELPETINSIAKSFDEPFSGVTSTFFLTKLISEHVKVALSGDGADELFGSYLSHRVAYPLHNFRKHNLNIDSLGENDLSLISPFENNLDFLSSLAARGDESHSRMGLYLWDDKEKKELLSNEMLSHVNGVSTQSMINQYYLECPSDDPLNRSLYLDFLTLLPDQVLSFVDRLSMAHSVEVRPPFLDYRLVEFVTSLPGSMKIKNGNNKHILKQALKGSLPDQILDRPKEGFVLPVNKWIKNELKGYTVDLLSADRLKKHNFFNPDFVKRTLDNFYVHDAGTGAKIWNMMMFQVWWENYQG